MSSTGKFEIINKTMEFNSFEQKIEAKKTSRQKISRAPGSGSVEIETPQVSITSDTSGWAVNCQTVVRGRNIAQVFGEVLLETDGKKYGPFIKVFLSSPENREVRGLVHPRWGSANDIAFEFPLQLNLLYCAERFTLACLIPEKYGVEAQDQVWSTEGIYQRGGGVPFRVKFEFDHEGNLIRKTGFYDASSDGVYTPFELLIEEGDTFEPFASFYDPGQTDVLVTLPALMMSVNDPPRWRKQNAPAGKYHVGVCVEDFDGKFISSHNPILIE